jgi:hypothetical protein
MNQLKKTTSYQESALLIAAILMLVILIVGVFLILGFLISRLNMALNSNVLQPPAVVQFDIDGFKKLGLISE